MKLSMLIFIMVVGLSSCTEFDPQPTASDISLKQLNCQGMPNPQRDECLRDIPPEYNKYQENREKLLEDRAKSNKK